MHGRQVEYLRSYHLLTLCGYGGSNAGTEEPGNAPIFLSLVFICIFILYVFASVYASVFVSVFVWKAGSLCADLELALDGKTGAGQLLVSDWLKLTNKEEDCRPCAKLAEGECTANSDSSNQCTRSFDSKKFVH